MANGRAQKGTVEVTAPLEFDKLQTAGVSEVNDKGITNTINIVQIQDMKESLQMSVLMYCVRLFCVAHL
jgi:hypothetical protein